MTTRRSHVCARGLCFTDEYGVTYHNLPHNPDRVVHLDPLTCDADRLPAMNPDFGPLLEPEQEWDETPIWHRLKLEQLSRHIRAYYAERDLAPFAQGSWSPPAGDPFGTHSGPGVPG